MNLRKFSGGLVPSIHVQEVVAIHVQLRFPGGSRASACRPAPRPAKGCSQMLGAVFRPATMSVNTDILTDILGLEKLSKSVVVQSWASPRPAKGCSQMLGAVFRPATMSVNTDILTDIIGLEQTE
jgi:hypothetical protein